MDFTGKSWLYCQACEDLNERYHKCNKYGLKLAWARISVPGLKFTTHERCPLCKKDQEIGELKAKLQIEERPEPTPEEQARAEALLKSIELRNATLGIQNNGITLFRDLNGNWYSLLDVGKNTATKEMQVVLQEDFKAMRIWIVPIDDFCRKADNGDPLPWVYSNFMEAVEYLGDDVCNTELMENMRGKNKKRGCQ